jgi:spoIIIJ-associated protein
MSDTEEITGTDATETEVAEVQASAPAGDVGEAPASDEVDDAADADEASDDADDSSEVEASDEAEEEAEEEDDEAEEQDEVEAAAAGGSSLQERLENEGDIAADYLEELLDIADLDGDLDMDVEGERAIVSVVGADLAQLVGERGEVLEALQELTRLAVYRETGDRSRLMLDISGHRAEVRRQLEELAAATAIQVKETGERVALKAMTPFERKVVHDAVAAAGLTSESEGVEPRRYVVVLPA